MMTETTAEIVRDTPAPGSSEPLAASRQPFGRLLTLAAGASFVAGLVHYVAAAEHRSEWASAAIFTAFGAFQIVWAAWLLTSSRMRVLVTGIWVNVVALAIWVVSRTAGLPVGHHAGEAEAVGLFDIGCVIVEAVVVASVLLVVRAKQAEPERTEPAPLT